MIGSNYTLCVVLTSLFHCPCRLCTDSSDSESMIFTLHWIFLFSALRAEESN
ncbi:hypothetical protein KC19_VG139800 [Ceratodon purpureus]|uniref:Uncharacterized protein n=1 Tax=Ceratodon purpureus TaxID=3225 RepID=A0A8T0HPW6_CERPU|nr:hypothetical protein KC19_VG139800 [Ceratodon purpureus]